LLVRQAKLGVSYRVKVPIGQGLANHPYRVLRDREGKTYRRTTHTKRRQGII